jgi:hypothetical protein
MTAKTKHGHKAHHAAHGADPGTPHERLNRLHAQPGRPEGAMHGGGLPAGPTAPPGIGGAMGGASLGAGPATDDEEGEQT